jgi:hypothetical protein
MLAASPCVHACVLIAVFFTAGVICVLTFKDVPDDVRVAVRRSARDFGTLVVQLQPFGVFAYGVQASPSSSTFNNQACSPAAVQYLQRQWWPTLVLWTTAMRRQEAKALPSVQQENGNHIMKQALKHGRGKGQLPPPHVLAIDKVLSGCVGTSNKDCTAARNSSAMDTFCEIACQTAQAHYTPV